MKRLLAKRESYHHELQTQCHDHAKGDQSVCATQYAMINLSLNNSRVRTYGQGAEGSLPQTATPKPSPCSHCSCTHHQEKLPVRCTLSQTDLHSILQLDCVCSSLLQSYTDRSIDGRVKRTCSIGLGHLPDFAHSLSCEIVPEQEEEALLQASANQQDRQLVLVCSHSYVICLVCGNTCFACTISLLIFCMKVTSILIRHGMAQMDRWKLQHLKTQCCADSPIAVRANALRAEPKGNEAK